MVFFTCDLCGESLKKAHVEKHTYRCRSNHFSCIDCQQDFDRISYAEHTKCISEDQKYGGAGYVAKANKGEVRQNQWVEQVSRAIKNVKDSKLRKGLEKIQGYSNIPRKEQKFKNFLRSSLRWTDHLCDLAWKAISAEAENIKKAQEEEKNKGKEEGNEPEVEPPQEEVDKRVKLQPSAEKKPLPKKIKF